MKISDNTFDVLKNFSSINQSLAFKAGNTIRTVSEQKNILAQAKVEENFPKDFAIYELNQFLGLCSLFDSAAFEFGDSAVVVSEGSTESRYTYTDPSMITSPPEKNIELNNPEVKFELSKEDYRRVINAANQLQLPEVVVRGKDGAISFVATDTKNPTSNEFSTTVGGTGDTFEFVFKVENMKMIQDDYEVEISSQGIAHFSGSMVEYWVATEAGSSYSS